MFVVVDAYPSLATIVRAVNSGHASYVGAAIKGDIFLLRRRHAEADVVSRCDLRDLGEGSAAIDRVPQSRTARSQPNIAFVPRDGFEVRRAHRRQNGGRSDEIRTAVGADIERTVGKS